jgi:hypothetical protein
LVEGFCKGIVGFRSPNVMTRVRVKRLHVYISMSIALETFVSFGIAYGLACVLSAWLIYIMVEANLRSEGDFTLVSVYRVT